MDSVRGIPEVSGVYDSGFGFRVPSVEFEFAGVRNDMVQYVAWVSRARFRD